MSANSRTARLAPAALAEAASHLSSPKISELKLEVGEVPRQLEQLRGDRIDGGGRLGDGRRVRGPRGGGELAEVDLGSRTPHARPWSAPVAC